MTAPHTLLDEWVPSNIDRNACPIATKAFIDNKYKARRFVFTPEVARMMARLMKDYPSLLLDNMQFALPPFETCYLDFPLHDFLDELGSRTTATHLPDGRPRKNGEFDKDGADKTLGILIHNGRINTLAKNIKGFLGCTPMTYLMHFEGTLTDYSLKGIRPYRWKVGESSGDEFIDRLSKPTPDDDYWNLGQQLGSTIQHPDLDMTTEQADFLSQNTICIEQATVEVCRRKGMDTRVFMEGSMGEVRNILLCLLWLNQTKLVDIVSMPAARGWHKGKNRAYGSYNLVTVKKNLTVRKMTAALRESAPKRRHEVQAYFRNYEKTPNCVHEWPLYPDEHGHWHCSKCPQWRTRVKEHMRGDATIGFVSKDYKVES